MATTKNIVASFPALKKLGFLGGKKAVPFVQQLEWTDCGAASLCMVMAYHGREPKLADVREAMGIGRDGVSAKAILDTAERYGMQGRGIKVDISQVKLLKPATILHWEFNHFVVFDKVVKGGDPDRRSGDRPARRPARPVRQGRSPASRSSWSRPIGSPRPSPRRAGSRATCSELMSEKGLFTRVIVMSLALRLIALALPLMTGMIIDRVVPRSDYHLLYVCLAAIARHDRVQPDRRDRAHAPLLHLRIALDTRMTLGFLDHMVSLPFAFFQRRSTGDLMMRVDSNGTVREVVTSKSMSAVIDGVFVLLYAVDHLLRQPDARPDHPRDERAPRRWCSCARGRRSSACSPPTSTSRPRRTATWSRCSAAWRPSSAPAPSGMGVEKWSNLYTDELNIKMRRARASAWVDGIRGAIASLGPMLILDDRRDRGDEAARCRSG